MKKKKISFTHLFLIGCFVYLLMNTTIFYAQNSTISGYVQDIQTNEKLINASVYDLNSKRGAISNDYGFYSLSLPTNSSVKLVTSYIGYSSDTLAIDLIQNEKYNFLLNVENALDEVVIKTKKEKPIQQRNDLGIISIPLKKVQTLPNIGGEADIIKALQLMPGVQSGNEASSHLFVRGGSPDQNLMLLDDVPLYSVSHLMGFVSIFNTDALKKVKLIKGGFPASYGNRLSSVIDIRMKEGNAQQFQGNGMIGLLASKVSVEGPIKKGTTSYIISVRRMLYDLVTHTLGALNISNNNNAYYFYDLNAKLNHNFSENDHIYFSLYMGDDSYSEKRIEEKKKEESKAYWGNKLFALRWNHLFSQKIFSNITLSYTQYRLITDLVKTNIEKATHQQMIYKTNINDVNAKIDFDYYIHPNYKLKFGVKGTKHFFNPGIASISYKETNSVSIDKLFNSEKLNSLETAIYIENEIKLGKSFTSNMGLRYVVYSVNGRDYHSVEPRFLMNLKLFDNMSIKASYAEMQQNIHLLTSGGVGMPIDLWMPATDKVVPQKSKQISIGIAKTTKKGSYEISLESYYKKMNDLITYKEGIAYYNVANKWEEKVQKEGIGNSYGLELLIQKKRGKITGWLAYTLSKTDRQFDNINFGKSYPYRYDKRHDISLVFQQKINKNIDVSATWVYGTGNSISLPEGKYQILSVPNQYNGYYGFETDNSIHYNEVRYFNGKNGFKMRDFHKLDIGINFRKEKKWGERTWNISIYNVYNRQNPHYYYFKTEAEFDEQGEVIEGTRKTTLKQQSLFPILPSVSYSFRF